MACLLAFAFYQVHQMNVFLPKTKSFACLVYENLKYLHSCNVDIHVQYSSCLKYRNCFTAGMWLELSAKCNTTELSHIPITCQLKFTKFSGSSTDEQLP